MKFTNFDLRVINESLGNLDGIRQGDQFTPYRYAGSALEAIIKNRIKLRPLIEAITAIHKHLLACHTPKGSNKIDPDTAESLKFSTEFNEFLQKEEEIDFIPIEYADLNMKSKKNPQGNDFAASVIEMLIHYGIIINFH